MHRELKKLLEGATGESQHIIAIVLDIRGFTLFCERVDSLDVATYIKKAYMKILDVYFPDAAFFKPTGDGLLVIIHYDEKSLKANVNKTIESCLKLVQGFNNLCSKDPMIYFDTPENIGIGIARGSACCIISEKKILDYSGKVLNLASRLMNAARPAGIVLDSKFGLTLLSDELKEAFLEDSIYIRGIAEEEQMIVYYTKEYTLIPDSFKKPIREPRWESVERTTTVKRLEALSTDSYRLNLKHKPLDQTKIFGEVKYKYIAVEGGAVVERTTYFDIEEEVFEYRKRGKTHYAVFSRQEILDSLDKKYVHEDMELTIIVTYPIV